jgi:hypothetical protein
MGDPVEEPDWLFASSYLAAAEGRAHSALRLAGAAEALSRRGGTYMNEPFIVPLDQRLADAGNDVGPRWRTGSGPRARG